MITTDRKYRKKEVMHGVTVLYTGKFYNGNREHILYFDGNGNRLYSNCVNRDYATKLIKCLEAEGKKAVIGPKAPWKDNDGKPTRNLDPEGVGVYIVDWKTSLVATMNENNNGKSFWGEIKCDYQNDEGYWTVDAWKTADGNEEGKVIAAIDGDTGKVFYADGCAREDPYAQDVIKAKVEEIMNTNNK